MQRIKFSLILLLFLTSCSNKTILPLYIDCNQMLQETIETGNYFPGQFMGLVAIENDSYYISKLLTGHTNQGIVHQINKDSLILEFSAINPESKKNFSWYLKLFIYNNSAYIYYFADLETALEKKVDKKQLDNSIDNCPLVNKSKYLKEIEDTDFRINFPRVEEGYSFITYQMDSEYLRVDSPYLTLLETNQYIYEAERVDELYFPIEHIQFSGKYEKYFKNIYKLHDYELIYNSKNTNNEEYFIEFNLDHSLTLYMYDKDRKMIFKLFNYIEKDDFS